MMYSQEKSNKFAIEVQVQKPIRVTMRGEKL